VQAAAERRAAGRGSGPERVPWSELRPAFLRAFRQGQHVAVIGPTGQGKTTLAIDLLDGFYEMGGSDLIVANKPRDKLFSKLIGAGWKRIRRWPPDYAHRQARRLILWPDYGRASQAKRNRPVFEYAMDMALNEGGWFVYMDEVRYFIEQMGMRSLVDEYWNGARSSKVTLVAGSQGTTWINRTMIRQETWLFLFKPRSLEERKEYADAAGDRAVFDELAGLRSHEFLLVHTPDGRRYISKVGT
jgi:energy-coupling factor transporter ATP-binding protein EcfA2